MSEGEERAEYILNKEFKRQVDSGNAGYVEVDRKIRPLFIKAYSQGYEDRGESDKKSFSELIYGLMATGEIEVRDIDRVIGMIEDKYGNDNRNRH